MTLDSLEKRKPFPFREVVERELERFPERTQDIVKRRFGVHRDGSSMTLDAIGRRYGITRERIRQIIRQVLHDFGSRSEDEVRTAIEALEEILRSRGGIAPRTDVYRLAHAESAPDRGAIDLLFDHSDRFSAFERDPRLHPSVAVQDFDMGTYEQILEVIHALFEKEKRPLTFDEVYGALQAVHANSLDRSHFESYMNTSARLKVSPFGHWGFVDWPEVSPKSTRDKAYVVLKYNREPLHFRDIAKHIDLHGLGKKRATNPQTVHNELIKDDAFSLVGRGMYGLKEWGHEGGTVKEAIEKILQEAGRPMKRAEIYEAVLREKNVKTTTILINLNTHFQKVGKDLYTLSKE